jgi:hypothetical protein
MPPSLRLLLFTVLHYSFYCSALVPVIERLARLQSCWRHALGTITIIQLPECQHVSMCAELITLAVTIYEVTLSASWRATRLANTPVAVKA